MRWVVLLVSVVSTVAAAQVAQTQPFRVRAEGRDTDTSLSFGAAECGSTLTIRWTYQPLLQQQVCAAVQFWTTDGECADAAGTNDRRLDDVASFLFTGATATAPRTGTFTVSVSSLSGFQGGDAGTCGAPATTKRHRVCGAFKTSNTFCGQSEYTARADPLNLVYDAVPPARPVITALRVQDSALAAEVAFGSDDVVSLSAEVRKQGDASFRSGGSTTVSASDSSATVRVAGLENDTTYDVRVFASDAVGNTSEPSDVSAGTPIRMLGFFQVYRDAGGAGRGCAAAPSLAGLALGLWLLRRRRA